MPDRPSRRAATRLAAVSTERLRQEVYDLITCIAHCVTGDLSQVFRNSLQHVEIPRRRPLPCPIRSLASSPYGSRIGLATQSSCAALRNSTIVPTPHHRLHRRTGEGEPEGQVGGAADLGHLLSAQPGDSRPEDAARHRRQVIQVDHAGSGHPVVFCEPRFSVEYPAPFW